MLSVIYVDFHLCCVPFMISVTYKPFMLSVVVVNAIMLSVVAPC
jgi:hypothetical protein